MEMLMPETEDPKQGQIEVFAANLAGALTDPERQEAALDMLVGARERQLQMKLGDLSIKRYGIMFLSEAGDPDEAGPLDDEQALLGGDKAAHGYASEQVFVGKTFFEKARERLAGLDLEVVAVNQEIPGRSERYGHAIMMLVDRRLLVPGGNCDVKLGVEIMEAEDETQTRKVIKATLYHPETERVFEVYGGHMPDEDEESREPEVNAEIGLHEQSPGVPKIVVGDKNNMRPDTLKARFLRAIYPIIKRLPSEYPTVSAGEKGFGPRQYVSLAQRLCRMAYGVVYTSYLKSGLVNTDPEDRPTMYQGLGPLGKLGLKFGVKIDHTFLSAGHFKVIRHLVPKPTMLAKNGRRKEISDHRPNVDLIELLEEEAISQLAA